ncbi:MAG: type II secretion system protein [Anaerolineae bacterium]|nr:type II secretion system protein [Phycisphaerae bacterium]
MIRSRLHRSSVAFTIIELLVVVIILTVLIAILLPALSSVRSRAYQTRLASEQNAAVVTDQAMKVTSAQPAPARPLAQISSFVAKVDLTPRLSVGTTEPESIYEARFDATLDAIGTGKPEADCEIQLPIPPQIISLGELSISIEGVNSDDVALAGDKLVWHGPLASDKPTRVAVQYNAVGRGLFSLQTPPGKIIDQFKIELTANGSDVRMLELSMQPTSLSRGAGKTTYVWDYKRLMFGRPIALDVLGIAPVDRLGELSWLGPLSVVYFGVVLGLIANAFMNPKFDRWMLLLILGTFTGAYPLMYFAQEFIPLNAAMIVTGALVLLVIALRSIGTIGLRLGLLGVALPGALIMTITLAAAIRPGLQGILLTAMSLGLFVLAMLLAPRLHFERRALAPAITTPTPA